MTGTPRETRRQRRRNRTTISNASYPPQASDRNAARTQDEDGNTRELADITAEMPGHVYLFGDPERPPGSPGRPRDKATAHEQLMRVRQTVNMLVHGATRRQAIEWLVKTYNISERHADRYLRAAKEEIVAQWELERPEMLATLLSQALQIYHNSIRDGQNSTALNSLQFQSRLVKLI